MRKNPIIQQRNHDLKEAYRKIIQASQTLRYSTPQRMIASIIAEMPAPRFYISPFSAQLYITGEYRNRNLSRRKRAMIADLVENYEQLRRLYPEAQKSAIYALVVEQPAKSFYMTEKRICEIIYNYTGR